MVIVLLDMFGSLSRFCHSPDPIEYFVCYICDQEEETKPKSHSPTPILDDRDEELMREMEMDEEMMDMEMIDDEEMIDEEPM